MPFPPSPGRDRRWSQGPRRKAFRKTSGAILPWSCEPETPTPGSLPRCLWRKSSDAPLSRSRGQRDVPSASRGRR